MSRPGALLAVCVLAGALAGPGGSAQGAEGEPARVEAETDSDDEDEGLRQRLTEREDKRRPVEPWTVELAGRPFTIGGEYEIDYGYHRRRVLGEAVPEADRSVVVHGLELEAFYSFGRSLSLFAQVVVEVEKDLLDDTFDEVSDSFVERGEMWVYSEDIAGSGLSVDVGRLDFEDERRWWWDDELDALRVAYETETFDLELSLARELASSRSDRSFVEPEHDRVLRWIGEASWDWGENHALELFALRHADRSPTDRPGEIVRAEREDESDARLTWVGARAMGVFELPSRAIAGYWLDLASVRGDERRVEYEELSRRRSVADTVLRRDVSGWAADAGLSWILPLPGEPRLFAGYAYGSGDSTPGGRTDRAFRQTALHANEAGFGGVERFPHYGIALDPELSNLGVLTLGAGVSLGRSSSLDLVYHHYRLAERADSLRDARLEVALTGASRELGYGLDLVLALEEWERLELQVSAAAFRAGRAFGPERDDWSYATHLTLRYAF